MEQVMKYEERIVFALREMYRRHGYQQFKMRKFEEYDLYARNKDFLVSDNIITFTDLNGKLMAAHGIRLSPPKELAHQRWTARLVPLSL